MNVKAGWGIRKGVSPGLWSRSCEFESVLDQNTVAWSIIVCFVGFQYLFYCFTLDLYLFIYLSGNHTSLQRKFIINNYLSCITTWSFFAVYKYTKIYLLSKSYMYVINYTHSPINHSNIWAKIWEVMTISVTPVTTSQLYLFSLPFNHLLHLNVNGQSWQNISHTWRSDHHRITIIESIIQSLNNSALWVKETWRKAA